MTLCGPEGRRWWWTLLLVLPCIWATTPSQYFYPPSDTTPVLDYLVRADLSWPGAYMRGTTSDGFQPAREYSHVAPSNGVLGYPVLGTHGSCVYSASTITNRTTSDTCRSYIKLKYAETTSVGGCQLTTGGACSTAWACQVATWLSSEPPRGVLYGDFFAFCGCNPSTSPKPGLSCPNNGVCTTLHNASADSANTLYDRDLPVSESNLYPERRVARQTSICHCDSAWQHWIRPYTGYGPNDPRLSDTPGYVMPPLRGGDDVILWDCSRRLDSYCHNGGIPSYLHFPDYTISPFGTPIAVTQEMDYASVVPCYSNETGLPGCGLDVLPCVCPQGYFGLQCDIPVWNDTYCGYTDDGDPIGNFQVSATCRGRGSCAGDNVTLFSGVGVDGLTPFLQSSKDELWSNTELIYCQSCDAEFFGSLCQVTCGNSDAGSADEPNCPDHATCYNNGTHLSPVPYCQCDSGYRDPNHDGHVGHPTDDSTLCVTCTNELDVDVPDCNNQGTCPLTDYTCYNLGCSGITNRPSTPLKCNCNASYVDDACNIPQSVVYSCGSQAIPVVCTYSHTSSDTDFKYTCQMDSILNTSTTPNERYPLIQTCYDMSLVDPDYLISDSKLRLLSGDDACAAIHTQCSDQVGEDICPEFFRDFDVTTGLRATNGFCDPPVSRQVLKATFAGDVASTVFCALVSEGSELWHCQRSPIDSPTFYISCTLSASWALYVSRPASFMKAMLSDCTRT